MPHLILSGFHLFYHNLNTWGSSFIIKAKPTNTNSLLTKSCWGPCWGQSCLWHSAAKKNQPGKTQEWHRETGKESNIPPDKVLEVVLFKKYRADTKKADDQHCSTNCRKAELLQPKLQKSKKSGHLNQIRWRGSFIADEIQHWQTCANALKSNNLGYFSPLLGPALLTR